MTVTVTYASAESCSYCFIFQVSFPPYIFEVLLFDLVDDTSSIARIENGMVLFTLNKLTEQTWGQLCSPVMGENLLFFFCSCI